MDKQKVDESQYIQQHLSNERTFLAWLRTGIAVVGIGFLAVTLHLNYGAQVSAITDTISLLMMGFSLIIGIAFLFTGVFSYFIKRKEINEETFRSSTAIIVFAAVTVSILILMLGAYFMLVLQT
ncbi:DUF202 domain-containing protein [Bacillus sp. B190/17]|uniref:DUF202 domain-containing protein n=1 Tax=Bacillus lumedeiriae TaxID=3058829 RepID=A0ABW8ICK2_9BACI